MQGGCRRRGRARRPAAFRRDVADLAQIGQHHLVHRMIIHNKNKAMQANFFLCDIFLLNGIKIIVEEKNQR